MRTHHIETPPAGFNYFADFLTPQQGRDIERELSSVPFRSMQFHGYDAKREVMHYGWDYAYDARSVAPTEQAPEWLLSLRSQVIRGLFDAWPEHWDEVLVTRYPPGAGIGWHRDAPMFGETVVGISLGAPCIMRFRRGPAGAREIFDAKLAPRSVYVISGAARTQWQHSIPPVDATRYSITFRSVRDAWKRVSEGERRHRA